jgi:hypothetical protein
LQLPFGFFSTALPRSPTPPIVVLPRMKSLGPIILILLSVACIPPLNGRKPFVNTDPDAFPNYLPFMGDMPKLPDVPLNQEPRISPAPHPSDLKELAKNADELYKWGIYVVSFSEFVPP